MDKNYAFDAFTREALEAWTIAIQRVCAVLLKANIAKNGVVTDTSESDGSWSDSKSCRMALLKIRKEECNAVCADCNAHDPDWVLMELGAFICIECAAVHRRMGSTISQVRSIQLDAWGAQQVEFLKQNGNRKVNLWWEGRQMAGVKKPAPPMITEGEREKYIRLKYEKKFFTADCRMLTVDEALEATDDSEKAARMREMKSMILTLVREDEEFRNELRLLLLPPSPPLPPVAAMAAGGQLPVEGGGLAVISEAGVVCLTREKRSNDLYPPPSSPPSPSSSSSSSSVVAKAEAQQQQQREEPATVPSPSPVVRIEAEAGAEAEAPAVAQAETEGAQPRSRSPKTDDEGATSTSRKKKKATTTKRRNSKKEKDPEKEREEEKKEREKEKERKREKEREKEKEKEKEREREKEREKEREEEKKKKKKKKTKRKEKEKAEREEGGKKAAARKTSAGAKELPQAEPKSERSGQAAEVAAAAKESEVERDGDDGDDDHYASDDGHHVSDEDDDGAHTPPELSERSKYGRLEEQVSYTSVIEEHYRMPTMPLARFEAENRSLSARRGLALQQGLPPPPAKIEAEDEREALRSQRKPSEDTLGRKSGARMLTARNYGTVSSPSSSSAAASASAKDPRWSASSTSLTSTATHQPPTADSPAPAAESSSSPSSSSSSSSTAGRKNKLRKSFGGGSRGSSTPLKDPHGASGNGAAASSPATDTGLVQKMSKRMTGMLSSPRRRRSARPDTPSNE
ncbi:Arf GTPase activating protein [Acanthamoeba castellanii str. Neff]|uniref:Arf GTPase activating protein n=1 Tax=Acanthamoeba castellanii (strain ATCC 30010 / Neff) TaxID=1257118 RepID=L8HDF3_ACACF|nr:Arf GTPase activating protein [Acanthamoeba castellanii str. Neff]ELR23210.1 Arf GTPase activating protein [Acanthamoeba castellanii str. Neff]